MLNSIKICFHDYQHRERLSNLFVNVKGDYTSTSGRIQRYQEIQTVPEAKSNSAIIFNFNKWYHVTLKIILVNLKAALDTVCLLEAYTHYYLSMNHAPPL